MYNQQDSISTASNLKIQYFLTHPNTAYDATVVIPYRDAPLTIGRAINSVRAQHGVHCEIIIINDGSSIESESALRHFRKTHNIRIIDTPHHGSAAARNLGVGLARSDVIAFLDADDELSLNALTKKIAELNRALDVGLVFGQTRIKWEILENKSTISQAYSDISLESVLGFFPVLSASNMLVRRAALEEIGGFDEGLRRASDQEWVARLCLNENWRMVGMDCVTAEKYVSSSSLWTDAVAFEQSCIDVIGALATKGYTLDGAQRKRVAALIHQRSIDSQRFFSAQTTTHSLQPLNCLQKGI